ncbi:MAG: hypothetical protein IE923_00625 [Micrococcales bacterium]|nr:hypothetical protein [Micrococcales bacterium]
MRQASAKVWVGGTALLAVLVLVAAWFLLIDPVMAQAADDTTQAESQRQQNDLLELEIAKLKEQATHLEEYKAELADLRLQMPVTGDGASISRELQSLAEAAGVTITSVAPSQPQPFVAAAPAVSDSATADDTGATDGSTAAATDDPASDGAASDTTTSTTVSGFYTIPISVGSIGSYESTVAFLKALQTEASRLYLVSTINAVTQDASGASGGRPATNAGDIELSLSGYAFVLTDGALPVDPDADAGDLPVPGSQANPFAPVG